MKNLFKTKRPARVLFITLWSVALLASSGAAMAHVRWALDSITPPRTNSTGLKSEPCGGAARTSSPAIFSGGQTIEVTFEETVNHPGYYRIAFSPAGDLNFDSNVLIENIPDTTSNGAYTREITLPTEPCTDCTLQVIQVMTETTTPSLYYSCADIQITDVGSVTAPGPVGNLRSQAGDTQASISWNNPASDFYRVVVFKNTSSVLSLPVDGTEYSVGETLDGSEVVYTGNASSFTATSLTNGSDYYFKVFSLNSMINYSTGSEVSVTPQAEAGTGGTGNTSGATSGDSGGGSIHPLWMLLMLPGLFRLIRRNR